MATRIYCRLEASIESAATARPDLFKNGFVAGGRASLDRILHYYKSFAGRAALPTVQCNAPWTSAVLEPGGNLRPCFFQPAYEAATGGLEDALNSPQAIAFRQGLDVERDSTCQNCVCSLNLPLTKAV